MSIDFRVTVLNPTGSSVLALDASGDLNGGLVRYEDTPSGCGAATIRHGLRREEIVNRGYWKGMNLVEISSGDNVLTAPTAAVAAGSTGKFYLDTNWTLDPAQGEDAQQLYFFDGATLTMRCPVQSISSDPGGPYAIVQTPIGGGGIPAYSPGTLVGRRRYCGRIVRRSTMKSRMPGGDITLIGLSVALTQVVDDSIITLAANVDIGAAILATMQRNASRWPFFTISPGNFPTTGFLYANTQTAVTSDRIINDMLSQITTSDQWLLRIGHDRTPRLIRLYQQSTNAYAYTIVLQQGVTNFEAVGIGIDDEDVSRIFNTVRVLGDTDPNTKQPVAALVNDPASLALYGLQLDGSPINNIAIKDTTAAARFGQGQLNQNSIATSQNKLIVYTKNDTFIAGSPGGVQSGDVVRGVACVRVTGFDQIGASTNDVPDSEIRYGSGGAALWTGGSGMSVLVNGGPNNSNAFSGNAGTAFIVSAPTIVVPGQVRSFDGYLDASAITAGKIQWQIQNVNTGNVFWALELAAGAPGQRVATQFTVPAGCTSIAYIPSMNYATGTGKFAQPNCNLLNRVLPYTPNYATPTIYGLATSVVTTIDLDKYDSWQECRFVAIEPDWNATVQESANAVLTALQAATARVPSIYSYTVSQEALGFSASPTSLSVSVPSFAAIFAFGTPLVAVGGNSFSLLPNAINRVWLNPNNSWTINTDTSTVPGAIFFGRFQTNAVGVIGSQFVASVGVIKVGVGNVDFAANLPAPTFTSAPSVVPGLSANGIAADVDVSIPLSNVPAAAYALQFYRRTTNTGAPRVWIPAEAVQLAGVPFPPIAQTVGASYALLAQSASSDFACGYVSVGGYGALTQFATGFRTPPVTIPTVYLASNGAALALTLTGTSASSVLSVNGFSAAVNIIATITNQPTDGSTRRYNIWRRPSTQNNDSVVDARQPGKAACNFQPIGGGPSVGAGTIPGPASGLYDDYDGDVTGGVTFDYGISLENTAGGESLIATIVLNFTTQVIVIGASSLAPALQNILQSNFNGLQIDGSGNLAMPGQREIYPAQTTVAISPNSPNASAYAGFSDGQLLFEMRFKLSSTAVHPGLVVLSDAGPSSTDYANGYLLQWLNDAPVLYKRVNGTYITLFRAAAGAGGIANPLAEDTNWHTLKLTASYGTLSGYPAGLAFGVYLDGIAFGYYNEYTAASPKPGANAGVNIGGVGPFLSGRCGPANRDAVGVTLIDPAKFGVYSGADKYAETNAQAIATLLASPADPTAPNDGSPMRSTAILRRHDGGAVGPGGNLLVNPALGRNIAGWTVYNPIGADAAYNPDQTVLGGRVLVVIYPGSHASADTLLDQVLANPQPSTTYTASGYIEPGTINAGGFIMADVRNCGTGGSPDGTGAQFAAASSGKQFFSFTFTTGTGTVTPSFRIRVNSGSTAPTVTTFGYFYRLKVEVGSVASAYSDDQSAHNVTQAIYGGRPIFVDGIDINALRPGEAGANVTENRVASDVRYGPGKAVAQLGADVTGSNTAANAVALGSQSAAAINDGTTRSTTAIDPVGNVTGVGSSRFAPGTTADTTSAGGANLSFLIAIDLRGLTGTWFLGVLWTFAGNLSSSSAAGPLSSAVTANTPVSGFTAANISVSSQPGQVYAHNLTCSATCSAAAGQIVYFNLTLAGNVLPATILHAFQGNYGISAFRTS